MKKVRFQNSYCCFSVAIGVSQNKTAHNDLGTIQVLFCGGKYTQVSDENCCHLEMHHMHKPHTCSTLPAEMETSPSINNLATRLHPYLVFFALCFHFFYFIAERLSARQLILRRISEIVCMYVCMYVSVTLRNPMISRATRKRSITCTIVTLRNVTAVPAIEVRGEKSSAYNYSAGRRRRCAHTTQWRPA